AEQLGELGLVADEMEVVRTSAHEAGDRKLEGCALGALAGVALLRDGDADEAERLARAALEVLPEDAVGGRIDTLSRLASAAWWPGDLRKAEAYTREALALAEGTDRRDLQAVAVRQLVWMLELRLDFDGAEKL